MAKNGIAQYVHPNPFVSWAKKTLIVTPIATAAATLGGLFTNLVTDSVINPIPSPLEIGRSSYSSKMSSPLKN